MKSNVDCANFKRHVICFFVVLSLFTSGLREVVWADDEKKIVIANGEWPPFLSKNLKHYGVFCHIISEAFALEGVTVTYEWVPWKRAYNEAERGRYDATATWVPSLERGKHFYYSDTILVNKKVFFHMKSYPFNWSTINDLKGIEIGGTIGYTYGEDFDMAVKEGMLNVQWVPTDKQNYEKLLLGRFQIFPQELDVGYSYINQYPPEQAELFTYHPKPIIETTHHLIFTKTVEKNKRLLMLFNNGLRRLKKSGKLDEYLKASRQGEYEK